LSGAGGRAPRPRAERELQRASTRVAERVGSVAGRRVDVQAVGFAVGVDVACDLARELETALARFPEDSTLDPVTLHGMGGLLHDYYAGSEQIFCLVAPERNGGLPAGERCDQTWRCSDTH
jgi:hypothetical protein